MIDENYIIDYIQDQIDYQTAQHRWYKPTTQARDTLEDLLLYVVLLADALKEKGGNAIQLEEAGEWYTIPADYTGVSYG
jgi:hypothetical protein